MNTRVMKVTRRRQGGNTSVPPAAATPDPAGNASLEPNSIVGHSVAFIEPDRRRAMIAEAAYFRAERRGFECGHELEDWYEAESEIDGMLARGEIPLACGI